MSFYQVFLVLSSAGAGACAVQATIHPDVVAWQRAGLAFFAAAAMCLFRLERRR